MRRSLINKYVAPSRCMLLPLLPQMAFDIINLLDFLYSSTFEVPEILWNCRRWFQPEWKLAYCRFFRINYRFVAVKFSPQKSLPRYFPADTRQSHHRNFLIVVFRFFNFHLRRQLLPVSLNGLIIRNDACVSCRLESGSIPPYRRRQKLFHINYEICEIQFSIVHSHIPPHCDGVGIASLSRRL